MSGLGHSAATRLEEKQMAGTNAELKGLLLARVCGERKQSGSYTEGNLPLPHHAANPGAAGSSAPAPG